VIAKESYPKLRKSSTFAIRQPSGGTTFQTTFSPVSFGKSFMKIRSAVPENGCLIVLVDGKNKKKQKTKKTKNKKNRKQKKHLQNIYAFAPPSGADA